MAKAKTAQELKAEASQLMKKAREQEKELLIKAKEAEMKILAQLGELTIKFLNGELEKNELKEFSYTNNLIEEKKENANSTN